MSTTKMTNGTNQHLIRRLNLALEQYTSISESNVPSKPTKPIKSKFYPAIHTKYERMGEICGICPYELREVLETEYTAEHELVINILKKFVAAVKLSGNIDLNRIKNMLSESESKLKEAEDKYQRGLQHFAKSMKFREEGLKGSQDDVRTAWGNILIPLIQNCDKVKNISQLSDLDVAVIHAIEKVQGNLVKNTSRTLKVDFQKCILLTPEKISEIITKIDSCYKTLVETRFKKMISTLTVSELKKFSNDSVNMENEPMLPRVTKELLVKEAIRNTAIASRYQDCWYSDLDYLDYAGKLF